MLNMFRTLIHPSSGACDFSIVSPHWSCVLVSMCVGVMLDQYTHSTSVIYIKHVNALCGQYADTLMSKTRWYV